MREYISRRSPAPVHGVFCVFLPFSCFVSLLCSSSLVPLRTRPTVHKTHKTNTTRHDKTRLPGNTGKQQIAADCRRFQIISHLPRPGSPSANHDAGTTDTTLKRRILGFPGCIALSESKTDDRQRLRIRRERVFLLRLSLCSSSSCTSLHLSPLPLASCLRAVASRVHSLFLFSSSSFYVTVFFFNFLYYLSVPPDFRSFCRLALFPLYSLFSIFPLSILSYTHLVLSTNTPFLLSPSSH